MRRVIATEDLQLSAYGNISTEEAELLEGEALQETNEVDQDVEEAGRMLDVSDAMEDLAEIADGIEEATPVEVALIDNTAAMAVAGTDITPEEVIPAMESYRGKRIATESIRERARQFLDSLLAFLKKIWEKIEGVWHKFFGAVPRLLKAVKAMRERVEATGSMTRKEDGKDFEISSGSLSVDYKLPKGYDGVSTGLQTTKTAIDFILGAYAGKVKSVAEGLAKVMKDYDPDDAAKTNQELVGVMKGSINGSNSIKGGGMTVADSRYSDFDSHRTDSMLGSVAFLHRVPKDIDKGSSTADVDRYRRSSVELVSFSEKADKKVEDKATFKTMESSQSLKLLSTCEDILKTIEDFSRGKGSKDLTKSRKDLEEASKKAASAQERLANKGKGDDEAAYNRSMVYYKSGVALNHTILQWATKPTSGAIRHGIQTVKSILALVGKNCAQYK